MARTQDDAPTTHVVDLFGALKRSMASPRALTTGSIRPLPSAVPPEERKPHGRVTDLVRVPSTGAYEGSCDGERVCVVEVRPGHWTMRTLDRLVDSGALVDVLGVQLRDVWRSPMGYGWHVTAIDTGTDHIELTGPFYGDRKRRTVAAFLDAGWRPEGSR